MWCFRSVRHLQNRIANLEEQLRLAQVEEDRMRRQRDDAWEALAQYRWYVGQSKLLMEKLEKVFKEDA